MFLLGLGPAGPDLALQFLKQGKVSALVGVPAVAAPGKVGGPRPNTQPLAQRAPKPHGGWPTRLDSGLLQYGYCYDLYIVAGSLSPKSGLSAQRLIPKSAKLANLRKAGKRALLYPTPK